MKGTKKSTRIIVNLFVGMFLIASSFASFADSGEVQIYIYPNQVWTGDYENTDSRTGNYSTVYARNHAVRPISGTDNYAKIKARATNGYGLVITDTYVLDESASSYTSLKIKEGYLSTKLVGFEFSGNTEKDAYATVSYDGR
ncbi:MAG: hypothetical protein HDR15_14785 [Lachnospiraceae bacterium]|nr:hypothetical protein [Lachnospiraceae bacterium]